MLRWETEGTSWCKMELLMQENHAQDVTRIKYIQQCTSPSLISQITVLLAGCLTGRWKKKTENLTPGYLFFKVHQ